ncbi:YkgJ family cysteine cluster protein [Pelagicoccus enzymogenes]|nr:YkgJ family cysteine cluster protein [Pelagicoccus enzymogenes]MDQ8200881.1 YkgJ family cysteine cluster protein [Pelagicoccus enzymogenes]
MSSDVNMPLAGETDALDCTDCGACCRCYPIFASVSDAEREPLVSEKCVRVDDFLGKGEVAYRMYPLAHTQGCAFLGENQLCAIYESRPEVCRRFERGSDQCLRARERVGVGKDRKR